MSAFSWGKVVDKFDFDMDGVPLLVIKYHPTKYINGQGVRGEYEDHVLFHCVELHSSYLSLDSLLIAWIAHRRLGLNQHHLVDGICRALCTNPDPATAPQEAA